MDLIEHERLSHNTLRLDINKSKETACSKKSYVSKLKRETILHYT
jgi:hypothetical protein